VIGFLHVPNVIACGSVHVLRNALNKNKKQEQQKDMGPIFSSSRCRCFGTKHYHPAVSLSTTTSSEVFYSGAVRTTVPVVPDGGYLLKDGSPDWSRVITSARTLAQRTGGLVRQNRISGSFAHVHRVATLAVAIAREEDASSLTIVRTALLSYGQNLRHSTECTLQDLQGTANYINHLLLQAGVPRAEALRCANVIPWLANENVAIDPESKKHMYAYYPESKYVEAALLLDFTGATGLARLFARAGDREYRERRTVCPTTHSASSLESVFQLIEETLLFEVASVPCESAKKRARIRQKYVTSFVTQYAIENATAACTPTPFLADEVKILRTKQDLVPTTAEQLPGHPLCVVRNETCTQSSRESVEDSLVNSYSEHERQR
jgi:hypothetical protein